MLDVQGVYKLIDDQTILRNITFTIEPGSIFGLIGPNGSGKSTLLRCITGIYKMDAGIIEFDNQPIFDNTFIKEKKLVMWQITIIFFMQPIPYKS